VIVTSAACPTIHICKSGLCPRMPSLSCASYVQEWFLPEAVLYSEEDELVLYDPNMERQVATFLLSEIRNPVAFVSKVMLSSV
jgi:hypothetical protein